MNKEDLTYCNECEAEFKVEHDGINAVMYCPFCGSIIVDKEIDEEYLQEE